MKKKKIKKEDKLQHILNELELKRLAHHKACKELVDAVPHGSFQLIKQVKDRIEESLHDISSLERKFKRERDRETMK